MGIREQIKADMKAAMKAGEKKKTSVLRMLLSELQYAETAVDGSQSLNDNDALKVVQSYQKRLGKSLEDFPQGDKSREISEEMGFVSVYLPQKIDEAEIAKTVDSILAGTEERNFGRLMQEALASLGETADGNLVNKVLKERLESDRDPVI